MVINGFKSFGKRVELEFGNRYNCVLGPNGSGKSNVLDALCFVLGKSSSKAMRAEKTGNLVYNGGKTKSPAKEGEVSIYFDNSSKVFPTEDDTVKVTRIVRPDGMSKYRINDKPRTRQQILELLSAAKINPNGYNIILQGDIIRIIEMSSLEKRQIVEEIAGISVYEDKKQKALRDLENVEGKLNEAEIILAERQNYLKDLKKERDQAFKYKELNDRLKQNTATFLKLKIDRKVEVRDDLLRRIDAHQESIDKYAVSISTIRKHISELKEEIKRITQEIEDKGEREQVDLQKKIEKLRVEMATNKTRLVSCEKEIARIKERRSELKSNLDDTTSRISESTRKMSDAQGMHDAKKKEIKEIEAAILAFKKKHKLDIATEEIEKKIVQLDADAEDKQKEVSRLREEQQELLRSKDKIDYQMHTLDDKIEKVVEIEKQHKSELEALKKKRDDFKRTTLELNRELDHSSTLAAKRADVESKLYQAREELAKLNIKNASIEEKISANMAIKKILEQKSRFGGVYGTIAQLGDVASRFSLALEAAAGPKINALVVQDDKVASLCIKYLRDQKLGSASFIPLNKIKAPAPCDAAKQMESANGVLGRAVDLISFDAKFKIAFRYVFGDTLVVSNIDTARRLGIGQARMTTLDGDIAELSGAMHGGYNKKSSSGSAFRDKSITEEIRRLEEKVAEFQSEIYKVEKAKESNEKSIVELRTQKGELEGDIIKMEKSLHLDSSDLDATRAQKKQLELEMEDVSKRINQIGLSVSDCNRALVSIKIEKQKIRSQLDELKNPILLAQLNAYDEKKSQLCMHVNELDMEIKGLNMQLEQVLCRDKTNIEKILCDLDKEEDDFKREAGDLGAWIRDQSGVLVVEEAKQKEFYEQFKGLFGKRTKLSDEVSSLEKKISDCEERSRKEEYQMNALSLDNAKVKAELAGLAEEFAKYEGVELFADKSEQKLRTEIDQCEKMREQMGNVNMRALEVYDVVEQEYKVLLEKKDKLRSERQDVLVLMEEIDNKKKDLFMKTFDVVNDNFKGIFSKLSSKGDAYLSLANIDDPLADGMDMKVRITGEKFLDLRSLSGGEKTMTALAFLFAIQEHEPASFYVLDEVDAALDKHNSEMFAKLVGQYADRAQYIIISHNDSVISNADTLYGVSMNEHGISNVVSLRI